MYAQLGDIKFEALKGLDSLSGKEESSLAEHQLIDGRPHLQKTGDKLNEVAIGIRINAQFANPETELQQLRDYKESGSILALITGTGRSLGTFVIKDFDYQVEQHTTKGEWVSVLINVNLVEYYDTDKLKSSQEAAKQAGFANIDRVPPITTATIPMQSQSGLIMADAQKINSGASATSSLLDKAKTFSNQANTWMDKANSQVSGMQSSLTAMEAKLNAATQVGGSAQALLDRVAGLRSTMTTLAGHLTNHDLQNAGLVNSLFHTQLGQFKSSGASPDTRALPYT